MSITRRGFLAGLAALAAAPALAKLPDLEQRKVIQTKLWMQMKVDDYDGFLLESLESVLPRFSATLLEYRAIDHPDYFAKLIQLRIEVEHYEDEIPRAADGDVFVYEWAEENFKLLQND